MRADTWHPYTGDESIDGHRTGNAVVALQAGYTSVGISPRLDLDTAVIFPSYQFGRTVLVASAGIVGHEEAWQNTERKTWGSLFRAIKCKNESNVPVDGELVSF